MGLLRYFLALLIAFLGAARSTTLQAAPTDTEQIETDWRKQDGIGTARAPSSYRAAVEKTLDRGDRLLSDLRGVGVALGDKTSRWAALRQECQKLAAGGTSDGPAWEELWRRVHRLRREIVFSNPLANVGPLVFVKQVPSMFSHQLTQYYGSCARPGGGVFVLEAPGRSMQCRQLAAGALPLGSFQHPEVSFDGRKVLFAYCHAETTPRNRESHLDRFYHLYEMSADGSGLKQLTDGPFDDFAPRHLPDGKVLFITTRRGGFHRCGQGPCPVYTLALANADGSDPRPISYHETHEWDPVVTNDGRVLYTRWDYVDRNAVFYQQLWSVRPDGSDVRIFFGNNTYNPVGIWEARPVPGSNRVMATAAAHHAMTAGSIILLDVTRGVDGPEPIARLTPDAMFPESEVPVINRHSGSWYSPITLTKAPDLPSEAVRWPGHCYRTPCPLSEKYFFAAYSFDPLIGEPDANWPAMFGLYLVDCFGNKELIYRDPEISSLWPTPLRPRMRPPVLPSLLEPSDRKEGVFLLRDVHLAWPPLPEGSVKRLRIVQVLPKTTWHANNPMVGLASASPGKQVLGTVPVEPDGSAYFRAPAGIPLAFQALDEFNQAVQVMRSVTYLQPGEIASCVGCHEPRSATPPSGRVPAAMARGPSAIEPGPDGSKPLSYPLLVQPVLDKHCVSCHNPQKPEGKIILTGEPQGHYTASYNALAPKVSYSAWGGKPGDFRQVNSEPLSQPGFFGSRNDPLMKLLRKGHYDVALSPADYERLATWMDANALFYGTFDPADQARQRRGERIAGPKLE
jgi:mono/diheme cytochrome c family protein